MKLGLELLNETMGGSRIFQVPTRKSQYLRLFCSRLLVLDEAVVLSIPPITLFL